MKYYFFLKRMINAVKGLQLNTRRIMRKIDKSPGFCVIMCLAYSEHETG